jgi:hypothetical protein
VKALPFLDLVEDGIHESRLWICAPSVSGAREFQFVFQKNLVRLADKSASAASAKVAEGIPATASAASDTLLIVLAAVMFLFYAGNVKFRVQGGVLVAQSTSD